MARNQGKRAKQAGHGAIGLPSYGTGSAAIGQPAQQTQTWRCWDAASYQAAKDAHERGEHQWRETSPSGIRLELGPIWDTSRGGRKWGGRAWKLYRLNTTGPDQIMYWTGPSAEKQARAHMKAAGL